MSVLSKVRFYSQHPCSLYTRCLRVPYDSYNKQ